MARAEVVIKGEALIPRRVTKSEEKRKEWKMETSL